MECLMAAAVFSQPLPHLEEPTRQIVDFEPDFDTQIGWGASQSTVLCTASAHTAGRTIFPRAASKICHKLTRVKYMRNNGCEGPRGGASWSALFRND
jgi:hypothetical protein